VIGTGSGTLSFATAATNRVQINGSGNVSVLAPTSGTALAVSGAATAVVLSVISGNLATTSEQDVAVQRAGSTANAVLEGPNLILQDTTNTTYTAWQQSGGQTELWQFNGSWVQILKVASTRAVTVNAPISGGVALTVTGATSATTLLITSAQGAAGSNGDIEVNRAGSTSNAISEGPNLYLLDTSATTGTVLQQSGGQSELWQFNSAWVQQWRVTTGGILQARDQGGTMQDVGWRGLPQNNQGANYTPVLADRGKSINCSASITVTIPSAVFTGGDAFTVVVGSGATVMIAQGSGLTLQWAGNGAITGTRTLTGAGIATVYFGSSTVALISGAGLT
jgi:hypothetical protein